MRIKATRRQGDVYSGRATNTKAQTNKPLSSDGGYRCGGVAMCAQHCQSTISMLCTGDRDECAVMACIPETLVLLIKRCGAGEFDSG